MVNVRTMALVALLATPAGTGAEQDTTNPNFRELAWLVGEWKAAFRTPGENGIHPTMTWSWGGTNQDFLIHRGTRPGPDGTIVPEYESIVVWHPTLQEHRYLTVYLGDGGTIVGDGSIETLDDGRVRLHMNVHYPEGHRLGDGAFAGAGGHTVRFQRTLRREGPDRLSGIFRVRRSDRWEYPNTDMPEYEDGFPWNRVDAP